MEIIKHTHQSGATTTDIIDGNTKITMSMHNDPVVETEELGEKTTKELRQYNRSLLRASKQKRDNMKKGNDNHNENKPNHHETQE
jgi:hypothetical protein